MLILKCCLNTIKDIVPENKTYMLVVIFVYTKTINVHIESYINIIVMKCGTLFRKIFVKAHKVIKSKNVQECIHACHLPPRIFYKSV